MAWTAPITFVANSVLTAAQLNNQLRDNMLETAPAKATGSGSIFVGSGLNQIVERYPTRDAINTAETTTSTSYTDLATSGPSVTMATGTHALVLWRTKLQNTNANAFSASTFEVSGATTVAASDTWAAWTDGLGANQSLQLVGMDHFTSLTPGTNTFTLKYRVGSGTATFANRQINVIPFS